LNKEKTGYFFRKRNIPENVKQPVTTMNTFESRLKEFIIEGIEDNIDVNDILDDIEGESVTAINIGNISLIINLL